MSWIRNWATSIFGGVAGVPMIIEGTFSKPVNWTLVVAGVGALLTGLFAKDFNER